MTTLVVGASGATGKKLVEQLLASRQKVKIIVRPTSSIPDQWKGIGELKIIHENLTDISAEKMSEYISDCQSLVSCLGHNMTWKGIYGQPGKLVTDTVAKLCEAVKRNPARRIKLVLMNTTGNTNKDLNERISFGEKIIIGLVRLLLPPHSDNEKAADYLRIEVGKTNPLIEWVVVRPDTLVNEENVTPYTLHPSPTRSTIFNPGKTSRINVGHFMARLIIDDNLWNAWKGQMPVIYNEAPQTTGLEKQTTYHTTRPSIR